MDDVWLLSGLSVAMLLCSFLAGSMPLIISLSEEKLQLVTSLGAGLLVGAALAVIIPEGVSAVYSHNLHLKDGASPGEVIKAEGASGTGDAAALLVKGVGQTTVGVAHSDHVSWIGATLVAGFVFMLLIDQLSNKLNADVSSRNRTSITATLGLVVHAAADGIALGASATTQHLEMEMIVFFAIMLHKAPTAFGLVTFLLHEGLERNRIRRHLLIFSLAAPIGALLTYFCIVMSNQNVAPSDNASGLVLLFSGGTFLYVATVHILPEISHKPHGYSSLSNTSVSNLEANTHSSTASASASGGVHLPTSHLLALIVGAVCPVFLSFGHAH